MECDFQVPHAHHDLNRTQERRVLSWWVTLGKRVFEQFPRNESLTNFFSPPVPIVKIHCFPVMDPFIRATLFPTRSVSPSAWVGDSLLWIPSSNHYWIWSHSLLSTSFLFSCSPDFTLGVLLLCAGERLQKLPAPLCFLKSCLYGHSLGIGDLYCHIPSTSW